MEEFMGCLIVNKCVHQITNHHSAATDCPVKQEQQLCLTWKTHLVKNNMGVVNAC